MRKVYVNDTLLNDYIDVLSISESILPPLSADRVNVKGRNGSIFIRQNIKEKSIKITYNIRAESFDHRVSIIDELSQILFSEEEMILKLPNGRKYHVSLEGGSDMSNFLYDGEGEIVFVAFDPIAFGDITYETLVSYQSMTYSGTYKTSPKITIITDGYSDRVKVKLLAPYANDYDFIEINEAYLFGEEIVIDMTNETVTENGADIMEKVNWIGDFFDIEPGEFAIEVSGGNATIEYIQRWL